MHLKAGGIGQKSVWGASLMYVPYIVIDNNFDLLFLGF